MTKTFKLTFRTPVAQRAHNQGRAALRVATISSALALAASGAFAQEVCVEPNEGLARGELCELAGISGGGQPYDIARGVNADGTVVVGSGSHASGILPFRWVEGAGTASLGVHSGAVEGYAYGVNADGTVVVGVSAISQGYRRAFRWVEGAGMTSLGVLNGHDNSYAYGVNADGTVVVGVSREFQGEQRAFRWVEGAGMTSLGTLTGGDSGGSIANGVNADGTVVVGESASSEGSRAFRWVEGAGMESLGTLTGGDFSSARGVNADGTVVVGESGTSGSTLAFRWVEGAGMESLGTLSGSEIYGSSANGVNADGTVVVGRSADLNGYSRAFRWVEGAGMENLGVLSGGENSTAHGVNADGTVVVGESRLAGGGRRAFIWRATADEGGTGGTMEDLANLTASVPVLGRDTALAFSQQQSSVTQLMGLRGMASGGSTLGNSASSSSGLNVRASTSGTGAQDRGHGQFLRVQMDVVRNSGNDLEYGQRSQALGALSYGFGLREDLTLGAAVSLSQDTVHNNAFDMDRARGLALWGVYDPDGAGGWQMSGAIGGSRAKGNVTRGRLLTDVVEAQGAASLTTKAVEISAAYELGMGQMRLTPSVSLGRYWTERSAYSESGAAFNAEYDAQKSARTTVTLAVDGEKDLGAGVLTFGVGVARDLTSDQARLTGTSDLPSLATFDIASDEDRNRTRPFASVGYVKDLGNGAQFTSKASASRAAYGTKPDLGLGFGYELRF